MIVETETAVYVLDLPQLVLRRYPRDEALILEEYGHLAPARVEGLRRDGQAIPFNFLAPLEVGQPAQFLLQIRDDGIQTVRTTTNVVRIIE